MFKILRIANNEKKLCKENVFTHFKILMINLSQRAPQLLL